MISKETVFEVIKECAGEKGVKMPDEFGQDLETHLPCFAPLKSFNQVSVQLCARVKKILEEDTALAERYSAIYSQISRAVRLKLVCLLDFQNYVTQPAKDGKSSRALLKEFLQTLEEGENWRIEKLTEWKIGGSNIGDRLYTRIRAVVGVWDKDVAMLILGEEGEKLLKRNPFEKREYKIRSPHDARRYLKLYLASLPVEESWSRSTLRDWGSEDGVRGESVIQHGSLAIGGRKFTGAAVRAILGAEADDLLKQHSFTKRILRLTGIEPANAALLEFMGGLKEDESWSITQLEGWISKGGIRGRDLYKWVDRNHGCFDECAVRAILGTDAGGVLNRNPYVKLRENIKPEDAQKAFKDFLGELKNGQIWSASDLISWNQKNGRETKGASLHSYIVNNYEVFDIPAFIQMFGPKQAVKLLAHNPFMPRHTEIVVSEDIAVDYLKRFLDARPEGKYWSPADLEYCGEIADGVEGNSVYKWMLNNITRDGKIDWMYILIKLIPLEYLKKHPFRHKFLGYITAKDRSGRHLKPAATRRREEIQRTNIATQYVHDDDDFAPSPEELFIAKEGTERMMGRKNVMRVIYKYLKPHECQLLNRFYAEEDIGDEQLLFLMGRVREIFLEHRSESI